MKRKLRCTSTWALAALIAAISPDIGSAPSVHVSRQVRLSAEVRVLGTGSIVGESPGRLELDPAGRAEASLELRWPDDRSEASLRLRAVEKPTVDHDHFLQLDAELRLEDGRTVRAQRGFGFTPPTTTLFEVYRERDVPLVLVLRIDATEETVLSPLPPSGDPVRLRLEIQRVLDGKPITVETDLLQTFVGEQVSYSFRLGSAPDSEAGRIQLRPTRLVGDIIEMEVDVSGTLPDAGGVKIIGRHEKWVASRGVASSLSFETDEPPTGYRFLVTPDF